MTDVCIYLCSLSISLSGGRYFSIIMNIDPRFCASFTFRPRSVFEFDTPDLFYLWGDFAFESTRHVQWHLLTFISLTRSSCFIGLWLGVSLNHRERALPCLSIKSTALVCLQPHTSALLHPLQSSQKQEEHKGCGFHPTDHSVTAACVFFLSAK